MPPGVNQFLAEEHTFTCCGNCSLQIPQVRLFYFPDEINVDCQSNQTSNLTSVTSAPVQKRVHSLVANGSTAVISGYTFTSPSLYLELLGTATVIDQCMTLSPRLINPIVTLPPGALSTWQPPHSQWYSNYDYFMIGSPWYDPSGLRDIGPPEADGISPLDIKDLACPTWGLGKSTSTDGSVILTIGPPWLPLIVPPMELFSLDPAWASGCTGIFSGADAFTTFDLFDPPIALTPAAWLIPPTPTPANPTTVPDQTAPSANAAKPANLPNSADPPAKTRDSGSDSPTPSPNTATSDPVESTALLGVSTASAVNKGDPLADPPSDPKVPSVAGDSLGDSNEPSSNSPDLPPGHSQTSSTDPEVPAAPVPQQGENSQKQAQGLGAIIYNAFGEFGLGNSPIHDDNNAADSSPVTPDTLTIAGQTIAPDPSGMAIGGSSLLPGGSAITISNTPVSLGSSGILVVGSSTMMLLPIPSDPPSTPFAAKALTVAGQIFTANPSAFSIAGTTISAGGFAVTVSGTVISLVPSGALAIGSSTVNFRPLDKTYTVAGQTFTLSSSAFAIAGTTISAGGPAVTIDGTVISVQASGTLIVGSSTIPLLTPQSTYSSHITIDGFGVEVESTFAVVDGVTLSPGAAGLTISGKVISLETGGLTLDIGNGRFALPTRTGGADGSINVQAFTGGQSRALHLSLSLVCSVCGTLMLLM
ncbi:MAG: hypothetical protein Q9161_007429 [Pseudevernia consocians]